MPLNSWNKKICEHFSQERAEKAFLFKPKLCNPHHISRCDEDYRVSQDKIISKQKIILQQLLQSELFSNTAYIFFLLLPTISYRIARGHVPVSSVDVELNFVYAITTFDVETQVVIFNSNSFIAEVGGLLGLLLGASVYNTYLEAGAVLRRLIVGKKG